MNKILVALIIIFLIVTSVSCDFMVNRDGNNADLGMVLQGTVSAFNTRVALTPQVSQPTANPTPSLTVNNQVGPVGPDNFPPDVNPLTGMIESDPSLLNLPPALISISNFPPSARKVQGGLSSAAQVYEVYIGEGMSRFLGIFYGSYPNPEALPPSQDMTVERPTGIGPIRSGRTVYESIRAQLNGFLVMASGDKNVRSQLSETTNIFGSDSGDINSAMIDVSHLIDIAEATDKPIKPVMLSGNRFDNLIPTDGLKAEKIWIFYNALNQVMWEYQSELGGYYRYQDNADESGKYSLTVDAFTGQPILYENVIVLFAEHDFKKTTLININLNYVTQGKALLFRDGLLFKIFWTTRSGEYEQTTGLLRPIRYINNYREAFPLKAGQTWIHLVDIDNRYWEANPARPFEALSGSGFWGVRFYDPTQNSK